MCEFGQCPEGQEVRPSQLASGKVKLPGGLSLNVQEWGKGANCCLFIHGFGDGGYVWRNLAADIAADFHSFALDLRGHGDSDWDPKARYDLTSYVADVVHVMESIGRKNLVLVGHSLGGDIAIRVASLCGKNILGLVVVDFGPSLNADGTDQVHSEFLAANQIYNQISDYAKWLGERRPLAEEGGLLHIAHCSLRSTGDGSFRLKADPAIAKFDQYRNDCEGRERELWKLLRALTCPVLVVRGFGSAVLPRYAAEQMVGALPNGHLKSVPMAGHAVMQDNPRGFADAVRPFLLSIVGRL